MKYKIILFLALIFISLSSAYAEPALDVVIYGEDGVDIDQGVTTSGGDVGSYADIVIDKDAVITGDVFATGDLDVGQNTLIDGSVVLGGSLSLDVDAAYTGTLTEFSLWVPEVTIPVYMGTPGTDDYSLAKYSSGSLDTSAYDAVDLAQSTTLTLSGGVYDLNTLSVGKNSRFIIGDTTLITVADFFHFDQSFTVEFADSALTAADFVIFVSAASDNVVGKNSDFTGIIYAPEGRLTIDQGGILTGAFLAKAMSIGKNVTVEYATGCTSLSCDDVDQDGDGYSVSEGDCDETQSGVNPAASEICDLIDNNCDGLIDEGVGVPFYQDADGDGFGNAIVTTTSCSEPTGYVGNDTDCNDADSSLSPEAIEICDGIDNNCNDAADEALSDCIDGVVINLPDDPNDVATELDTTTATTLAEAAEFLYTGTDPIQTGVAQDAIDVTRAAVVRGLVYDDVGDPLYGVTISVLNHDEYGQTISRRDGSFDLVINGGGLVTIVYQKDGYLTAHRQVAAPWQDTVWSPDVVLKTLDTTTHSIVVAATEVQVAQGSLVSDDDGARTATVLFPSGTTAELVFADGSTQMVTEPMVVRATEYTVGANGPSAMPASLPTNSAYTYAVELSIDEAISRGASRVEFNQAVSFYVEDFLDFPVGSTVPTGYYDRDLGSWVPIDDGVVIAILGDTSGDGITEISMDTAGSAASSSLLASYGFTTEELVKLTELYAAGNELWRVQVNHFSTYDCNWAFAYSPTATVPLPEYDDLNDTDSVIKNPVCQAGSVIQCENQVLGENINITGTPFSLVYQSDRVPGRLSAYTTKIPLTEDTALDSTFDHITLEITIAGQRLSEEITAPGLNDEYTFTWDGLDGYGRTVIGSQTATIKLGYAFDLLYAIDAIPSLVSRSFGQFPGTTATTEDRARTQGTLWVEERQVVLGTLDARSLGLGGWTLDVHHFYDPDNQELYLGNGTRLSAKNIPDVLTHFAGTGTLGYSGDGGLATAANLTPVRVATDAAGNLYIGENSYIRKINTDGIITTIAGTGATSDSGDGGLALAAGISSTYDLALDKDDNIYILQRTTCRIRKIDAATQIITTFAGTGTCGFSGDGGAATTAKLNFPSGLAVDSQGNVYVADTSNYRIRKIDKDGIITTIAGTGFNSDTGDGGLAINARISLPVAVAIDSHDTIYTNGNLAGSGGRIRKINPDGKISTVLYSASQSTLFIRNIVFDKQDGLFLVDYRTGAQTRIYQVDAEGNTTLFAGGGTQTDNFTPATAADFDSIDDVTFDAGGNLYLADYNARKIKKIGVPFPVFSNEDIVIAATDGKEIYHFDANGKHQATLNALTGESIHTFGYDTTTGLLSTITDGDGNITALERDALGDIAQITAPYGQTTDFALTADGYLETATNPNDETMAFAYDNGLLQTLTDAKGNTTHFTYDADGKLVQDTNTAGGFKTLSRTEDTDRFAIDLTTAEGVTDTYTVSINSDNTVTRTQTDAAGRTITTEIGQDDSKNITYPNGMEVSVATTGDPRFGLQAPILKEQITTTPSGLTNIKTMSRSATVDSASNLLTQTDTSTINGKTTTSSFDSVANEMTQTSPEGRIATFTLDTQSRVINTTIPNITPIDFTYTTGLLTQITQGSRVTNLTYNTAGWVDAITNPLSQSTNFTYDANGRVATQTLADGRVIAHTYDANGNLATLTPPSRPSHSFDYTSTDLVNTYTPPDIGLTTNSTQYAYDLDKRLTLITRPDAKTIALNYDTAGRLDTTTIQRGIYTYAYSATTGNLTTITDPNGGTLAYTYDGALPLGTTWAGDVAGSVSRTFNNDFQVSTQWVNGTNTISLTYDNDNLLTAAGALTLTRDADNGLITATDLMDTTTTRTYNSFGEPSRDAATTELGTIYDVTYTRDDLGRITEKTETVYGTTTTHDYTYDTTGRLTNVTQNSANISTYVYDDNGNRMSYTDETTSITTTGMYDNQDRLTSYGDTTYTYTDNGELATKTNISGTTTYAYDELGNLLSVNLSDGTLIEYVIDGQNRRIGKKVNGSLTQGFLYDDQLKIVAELDSTGTIVSHFVYATKSNVPDYFIQGTTTYRIISDHLGSPRLIINADTGDILQQIEYDEFGRVTSDTSTGFQPFGFAGGLYDSHTGLVRFGARDYDAEAGRWLSKDPIFFDSGEINLFGYAFSDPVNFIDPDGENAFTAALPIAATAAAIDGPFPVGDVIAIGILIGAGTYDVGNILDNIIFTPIIGQGKTCPMEHAKTRKSSKKEKATDAPSWVKGKNMLPDESGKDAADRLLDEKYGPNKYPKGPGSEHNKIKKYFDNKYR